MRHLVLGLVMALLLSASTMGASGIGSHSPMAFIPGSLTNSIAVIDTRINQVAGTFDIGNNGVNATPFGVAISPDGLRVFVSNFMSGNVMVIDAKTHDILAEIPVGVFPSGIAIDPKGERLYVTTSGDGNLRVFDASDYSRKGSICLGVVIGTRCVGSIPRGVAVDPKAPRVYVTNKNGGGVVAVVDTVNLGLIQKVIVGGEPLGIVVALDGSRLYVGLNAAGQVAVLNTADYKLIGGTPLSVGGGPFGLALSPKDGRLYVANEFDGTVSVIDTGLLRVVGSSIPVGSNPRGLSVTEDGKRVYVANWGSDSVSVIDTGCLTLPPCTPSEIHLVTGSAPIAFGHSITRGVAAIDVAIDIKPGSGQNTINLGSHGVTPVAILSTSTFDAPVLVNPATVKLAGAPVQLKGNGLPVIEERDVNGDGLVDLVVHVRTDAMVFSPGDTTAVLEGMTWDDQPIQGEAIVRFVPGK